MLKKRRFWIVIALTVITGCLVAGKTNVVSLENIVHRAKPYYFFSALLLAFLAFWAKSAAWLYLYKPIKKTAGVHRLFSSLMIGYTIEEAIGPRLRELVRTYAASDIENDKFFSSVATVVLNRVVDGIVLALDVLIITGFFFTLPSDDKWPIKVAWSTLGTSLVLLGALYVIKDDSSRLNAVIKKVIQWLFENRSKTVLDYYRDFLRGLAVFEKWNSLLMSLLFAALARVLTSGYYWSLGNSLGVNFSAPASFLLSGLASMRVFIPPHMVPGTPQFRDLFGWNLVHIFHLSPSRASIYGPSLLGVTGFFAIAVGLLCLFLEAFRRRRARRSS